MPANRNTREIQNDIETLELELEQQDLPDRARAALQKNLELKRKLLASLSAVDDSVKTLHTELDSMESLLEVLHQNSIALRDPQAISEELDSIVRQAEDSERVVREMESLLRSGTEGLPEDLVTDVGVRLPVDRSTAPAAGGKRMRNRPR
jgi:phage shock protein A